MARCPRCAHEFFARIELPVEPLFTLDIAAELVPFTSAEALRRYVARKHPEWQRFYRVIQHGKRRTLTKFLSAEQVATLRAEVVRSEFSTPDTRRRAAERSARKA